jgi:glucan phosphoethanolaminetransferase (alkaline phosphatase superfamily)
MATTVNATQTAELGSQPGKRRALWAPLADFWQFCRSNLRWTVCMTALVLLWTAELYLVQHWTLISPNKVGPRFEILAPIVRLVMDLLFIAGLCLALRPRWLMGAMVLAALVYLGLFTYTLHFGRSISLLTILNQWSETLQVRDAAVEVFPRGIALLLAVVLGVKIALLVAAGRTLPRLAAVWSAALVAIVAYVGLSAATTFVDPLHFVTSTRGVGRLGLIRGYLGPWLAEWYYLNNSELLRRAVERRQENCDHITPVEVPIPIHKRLVIIQVESLDTNALGYKVDGVEVTPFLNELKNKSMYYRVRASHDYGSSDADFAMLNGVLGSPDVNTWFLRAYPYDNTTPQLLKEAGYKTTSLHGNTGDFYCRRTPYEKLGFDQIYFREELDLQGLPTNSLGVTDKAVFGFSAEQLERETEPVCHFVITLTTHAPYTGLEPDEQEIYPHAATFYERYINNLRYIDNCLRDYITRLGPGTTVMIYADHPTEMATGFKRDCNPKTGEEYIPVLIYDSDRDLRQVQKTRDDPRSTDGTWHMVDVANYLRAQIKRAGENAQAATAKGEPDTNDIPKAADQTAPAPAS